MCDCLELMCHMHLCAYNVVLFCPVLSCFVWSPKCVVNVSHEQVCLGHSLCRGVI